MGYLKIKSAISDIYDYPHGGYGFSINCYGGDLKDDIINYDTMLRYLYDNDIDAYHKGLLNRPVILRVMDKYMPSFEILYTYDEIKEINYRHKNNHLKEYGLYCTSNDVKWYRFLRFEDISKLHRLGHVRDYNEGGEMG